MPEFCDCPDWEPCPCGGTGPCHCQYCCKDLTPEQMKAFDFNTWEHIPPRPTGLPQEIYCGACNTRVTNPTKEQVDFHFNDEHLGLNQVRRSALWTPPERRR